MNQQIRDYILEQRARGVKDDAIKSAMMASGWTAADIDAAFAALVGGEATNANVAPTPTLSALPGATDMLKEAWQLFIARLGTFIGISFLPLLLWVGFFVVLVGGVLGFSIFSALLPFGGSAASYLIPILIAFVVVLGIILVQIWGKAALLIAIRDSGERIGIVESYKRGWQKLWSYLWVALLVGFVVFGGTMLFIIPGLIFIVWFYPAIYIVIAEDVRGMDALIRARAYVRGKWLSVLWRLIFIGLVVICVTYIPSALLNQTNIPYLSQILQTLLGLLIGPLATTYGFVLYRNLRSMYVGEMVVAQPGSKWPFIVIGFLGGLIIPLLFLLVAFWGILGWYQSSHGLSGRVTPQPYILDSSYGTSSDKLQINAIQ